jgi:hypothetical protein
MNQGMSSSCTCADLVSADTLCRYLENISLYIYLLPVLFHDTMALERPPCIYFLFSAVYIVRHWHCQILHIQLPFVATHIKNCQHNRYKTKSQLNNAK